MEVMLDLQSGPMVGQRRRYELSPADAVGSAPERLILGRDPGPGGCLLDGDDTVSRKHGALLLDGPWVLFENLSSNGAVVNKQVVLGRERLEPGTILRVGRHEIQVIYHLPTELADDLRGGGSRRQGLLAKPLVQVVLAIYLLGLGAVAWLLSGDSEMRSFTSARSTYERSYLPDRIELDDHRRRQRLAAVDRLRSELDAQIRSEQWPAARDTCRRMMAVDGDPSSPIYRFAALRLAELAGQN